MKNFILFTITCAIMLHCSILTKAQVTVTFKPASQIGEDARIQTMGTCIPYGTLITPADQNYGNYPELHSTAWTYNTNGCPWGNARSLLKFTELANIPSNASIVSAELKLFGIPFSPGHQTGNSCYPGTPSTYGRSCPNTVFIQQITSPWNAQTVTWNTQPTTTTDKQIIILESTTQWNFNFVVHSDELREMVQFMVSNPSENYGWMLKLETEDYYRSLLFASSDHSDSTLHPQLTVTYTIEPEPCPCEANFSYMGNTAISNTYSFMASNSAIRHLWTINGNRISNESFFTTTLYAGNNKICYNRFLENIACERCITICIPKIFENDNYEEYHSTNKTKIINNITPGDVLNDTQNNDINKIKVYPNPTNNEWNIELYNNVSEKITISLYDLNGRLVHSEINNIVAGKNFLTINAKKINKGNYVFEIKGNNINFREVVIRY